MNVVRKTVIDFYEAFCTTPNLQGFHSDWKIFGKMGRYFPVREKSRKVNRLEKSGKIIQYTGKVTEFKNSDI